MIRPSALQMAEKCGLSSRLAREYPDTCDAAERGSAIHDEIAAAIREGRSVVSPEGAAAVAWFRRQPVCRVLAIDDTTYRLNDDDLNVVTEGTPDLVYRDMDGSLVVVDWKTGLRDRVAPIANNLQLAAYAIAVAAKHGSVGPVQVCVVFLDGESATADGPYDVDMDLMLPRILAAAEAEAVARTGRHCQSCYQSGHCPSYLLPAHEGPSALAPFLKAGGLAGRELEAIQVVSAMKAAIKKAEGALKNHVALNGPVMDGGDEWGPVEYPGRVSGPSAEECHALGLGHLVKRGEPYVAYRWRKVSK